MNNLIFEMHLFNFRWISI